MRRGGALLGAVSLSACVAVPGPSAQPEFRPDAGGIEILGSPPRIDFGRSQEGVVVAVNRLVGRPPTGTRTCEGATLAEVTWRTGLTLAFRDRAFVGWRLADGGTAGEVCGR